MSNTFAHAFFTFRVSSIVIAHSLFEMVMSGYARCFLLIKSSILFTSHVCTAVWAEVPAIVISVLDFSAYRTLLTASSIDPMSHLSLLDGRCIINSKAGVLEITASLATTPLLFVPCTFIAIHVSDAKCLHQCIRINQSHSTPSILAPQFGQNLVLSLILVVHPHSEHTGISSKKP